MKTYKEILEGKSSIKDYVKGMTGLSSKDKNRIIDFAADMKGISDIPGTVKDIMKKLKI